MGDPREPPRAAAGQGPRRAARGPRTRRRRHVALYSEVGRGPPAHPVRRPPGGARTAPGDPRGGARRPRPDGGGHRGPRRRHAAARLRARAVVGHPRPAGRPRGARAPTTAEPLTPAAPRPPRTPPTPTT